jgi:hypothetical protein
MPLSPADQQKLDTWIADTPIGRLPCPVCGPVRWSARPAGLVDAGPDYRSNTWRIAPDATSQPVGVLLLVCPTCGLMQIQSLIRIPLPRSLP